MAIPHCCPVCNGAGTTAKPPYVAGDQETWDAYDCRLYPCPACKGTGIVWEKSEAEFVYNEDVIKKNIGLDKKEA